MDGVGQIAARRWRISAALFLSLAAIAQAGAAPAPVDKRPDPDACTLLTDLDLEPLLFASSEGKLDGYNFYPAPGLATCRWYAFTRDHAADAVPRSATLSFYHIANRQRAQAQLDRQPHRDIRPSMALTGQGDDAIARPSATLVFARHGAYVAVIDASRAELDNPNQLEARYLLDALALKAAGATVKSPPWAKPGEKAEWTSIAAAGSAGGWSPPPHPVAGGSEILGPLIHGLKALAGLRFQMMFVGTPLVLALFFLGNRSPGRMQNNDQSGPEVWLCRRRRWPTWAGAVLLAALIGTDIYGPDAANALINRYGTVGAASVTGSFATSTQYNRHEVIGYDVLIGTADKRLVVSQFRTDDFNVRGLGDTTIYPGVGDVFTVRYLAQHPKDFVIRNDDQSPWARKLACARLASWRDEATRRNGFAPGNAEFRGELGRAESAGTAAGCPM